MAVDPYKTRSSHDDRTYRSTTIGTHIPYHSKQTMICQSKNHPQTRLKSHITQKNYKFKSLTNPHLNEPLMTNAQIHIWFKTTEMLTMKEINRNCNINEL